MIPSIWLGLYWVRTSGSSYFANWVYCYLLLERTDTVTEIYSSNMNFQSKPMQGKIQHRCFTLYFCLSIGLYAKHIRFESQKLIKVLLIRYLGCKNNCVSTEFNVAFLKKSVVI